MKINIIKLNFEDVIEKINLYKQQNGQPPVILLNSQTFKILKKNHENIMSISASTISTIPQLFGCYVSIGDWLSFGEVDIR